jgi:type I restriction-modification system DNA methylase subunit
MHLAAGTLFEAEIVGATWAEWRKHFQEQLRYPDRLTTPIGENALAVYRDDRQTECLALVIHDEFAQEAKGLFELASRQGAEFICVGDPSSYRLFQRGDYGLHPCKGLSLPSCAHALDRRQFVQKRHVLPPFRSEDDLRRAFAACHDAIYFETAKDPAAAFDLLSLVIAAKVLDEHSSLSEYRFARLEGESAEKCAARLEEMLARAKDWLAGTESNAPRHLSKIGTRVAETVFEQLQNFSLTLTGNSPVGTDLLGVAYEQLVGATFRGELGSYFTPRNIADFIVRLLDIRNGLVFDPSCGSAGLLIAAKRFASSCQGNADLYGNDLNPRMVEAARLNFLLRGVSPNRVFHGDGLDLGRPMRAWFGKTIQESVLPMWDRGPGEFDFVVANPPFAGHEKADEILARFATSRRMDGSLRSLNKTIPFLEVIVASLKFGGKAGVVIPTSILNAEEESFVRFREMLLQRVELLAIVGLPEKAFVHTDCGVHGALLFFQRKRRPRSDYNLFVTNVSSLGYDRLGKPTRDSDLPRILGLYGDSDAEKRCSISVRDLIRHQRWDTNWIQFSRTLPVASSADFVPLTDLIELRDARWSRRELVQDAEYRYFEVADTDIHTGRIEEVHTTSGFELAKKGRIRNRVKTGDLLLPNHRDSLMATSAKNGRSVVIVEACFDGVLTTDRFMVLRPKVDVALAASILNSRGVRRQLIAQCRGAASLDIRAHTLDRVLVPCKLLEKGLAHSVRALTLEISSLRSRLAAKLAELNDTVETAFSDSNAPLRPPSAR